MPSPSRSALVAGVVAAAIAVGGLAAGAALLGGQRPGPSPAHDAGAAEALIGAYRRSRTVTYRAESVFRRETRAGREFSTATVVVQTAEARLVRGDNSVDGVVGGHRVGCSRPQDGPWSCRRGASVDIAAEVDEDASVLRELVTGPVATRLYSVRSAGGCFHLRLTRAIPAPPYGREAAMCFDRSTGALSRLEVRRAEGVDLTVATRITHEVGPEDLGLPAPITGR